MSRAALGALALAVVLGLVFLLRALAPTRTDPAAAPESAALASRTGADAPGEARSPAPVARSRAVNPAVAPPAAPPPGGMPPGAEAEQSAPPAPNPWAPLSEKVWDSTAPDDAERIERAAAEACYRGEPGKHERIELHYTLHVRGGVASVVDVRVARSQLDARLTQCIVDVTRFLRWQENTADRDESAELEISILDLQKRSRDDDD